MRQPVQRVVEILDGVSVAVGLRDQVPDRVIGIALRQPRRKRRLRHAAIGVVAERGNMAVGVGDRNQVSTSLFALAFPNPTLRKTRRVGAPGHALYRQFKGPALCVIGDSNHSGKYPAHGQLFDDG